MIYWLTPRRRRETGMAFNCRPGVRRDLESCARLVRRPDRARSERRDGARTNHCRQHGRTCHEGCAVLSADRQGYFTNRLSGAASRASLTTPSPAYANSSASAAPWMRRKSRSRSRTHMNSRTPRCRANASPKDTRYARLSLCFASRPHFLDRWICRNANSARAAPYLL